MRRNIQGGFTLIEVLAVVVVLAILAAVIIPQYTDSATESKIGTTRYNVQSLRSLIQVYRGQHGGKLPSGDLHELIQSTDASGATGTGAAFPYGPYVTEIPKNALTDSSVVTVISNNPATASDATGTGGWLYNPATGGIWIDDNALFGE
jgi:prepilin-type N-terminal cleavage/methylation domain-containing protein